MAFLFSVFLVVLFNASSVKAVAPTIESFKTSYQTLRSHLNFNKDIQLFGGGLVLSEFNDDTENIYAGHIGGFWAPPFYSSPNGGQVKEANDWRKGFNMGLVFYNYTAGGGAPELASDPATEAFWYPSKMVVSKFYPGAGGGTEIKGVKVALPGVRGFGLKLTVTNKSPSSQSLGVLLLGSLPTFEKLVNYDGVNNPGWSWMQSPSSRSLTNSYYDPGEKMVVIEDTANSAYLAVGLSEDPDSWGVDENYGGNDYNYPLYNQFRNQKEGHLSNSDTDNDGRGTTFGLVSQAPALAQNQSHTFSLVAGMGSTKEEAMDIVRTYKNRDIEAEADNFWNSRLNNLFSNLPSFISGDETLNKIYRNSALTYLINRWTTLNLVGELAGYSQSSSFYPWMLGTAGFFPLADAPFWKEQLKKVLILDFANCLAYDAVPGGANRCDHGYTYNNVSVIDGVYRYVTSTSDHKFLDETVGNKTVFQHLQDLAAADDGKEYGSDHLADFGTDHELYEYDIHCDKASNKLLQGKYTGLVVSPNAERIVAHREIAELAEKRGDTAVANTHRAKAGEINTGLQTLWNPVASWFDSISLYDEGLKSRITPLRNTFWGMYPLLLLQYDGLLTDEQKQGLLKQLPQFRGEYGLTSVSTNLRSAWCVRTDWHGPGLYSGATGAVLTGLFKNGQEMEAYDLLSPADGKGYAYLAEMPYLSQAFPSDTQTGGLLPAYLEGVSLAQSLIEGMFGVFPNANQTKIAPHIPARLLSGGPVELRGLKTQGHIWNIKVTSPQNQELDLIVDGAYSPDAKADHFRFEYEMEGTLSVNVSLLQPNTPFTVMAIPVAGGDNVTANGVTDNSGAWQFQLPLHGHYIIRGQTGQSSVTSLTFNNQPLDLAGQPLNTSLTPGPTIDVPVTINYSSGSPRNLIIRFKYETPEPTATTASVSTVSTPAPETTSTGPGNDPKGWLDATFNASCTVSGWTCDGDDFNTPIDVHFYTDGGGTSDKFLGSTKANIQREQAVGDQCGGQRSRGYAFTLPDSIHDGKAHRVYAYGINIGGGTNIQLSGSPKSITCPPRI